MNPAALRDRHRPGEAPAPDPARRYSEIGAKEGEMVSVHAADWTYSYASPEAIDVRGLEPEHLIGKSTYEHVHPDDLTRLVIAWRYAHEASPFTIAYRMRRGDGLYAWVETTTTVRGGPGDRISDEFICHTRRVGEGEAIGRVDDEHRARLEQVEQVLLAEDIRIVFQPVIELETGRVIAYEALSRFPGDPARTPDRWFADAWAVGLGIPLELLAVRTATRALAQIPAHVDLSVNASPPTLAARGFLNCLGRGTGRITVELTEHLEIPDYAEFSSAVAPLRSAGGKLAIDDFGAGFASLKHIISVRPDRIKLDISLTERIPESSVAHALATALLSFAEEIGVEVIAEGIETEEELDALTEIGVRVGQGFHFGVPAPLDEVLAGTSA